MSRSNKTKRTEESRAAKLNKKREEENQSKKAKQEIRSISWDWEDTRLNDLYGDTSSSDD